MSTLHEDEDATLCNFSRYQASYRELAKKYPSFRQRSEVTELIVEITLQPWHSFRPDGIILFSDILTPLPALGVQFEIDDIKGPILEKTVRSLEQVHQLHDIDFAKVEFVGNALTQLRQEVNNQAAILGFVGSPWTLATYIIEGGSSSLYKNIKSMCHSAPEVLDALLSHLSDQMASYICYQIDSGAQCVQVSVAKLQVTSCRIYHSLFLSSRSLTAGGDSCHHESGIGGAGLT